MNSLEYCFKPLRCQFVVSHIQTLNFFVFHCTLQVLVDIKISYSLIGEVIKSICIVLGLSQFYLRSHYVHFSKLQERAFKSFFLFWGGHLHKLIWVLPWMPFYAGGSLNTVSLIEVLINIPLTLKAAGLILLFLSKMQLLNELVPLFAVIIELYFFDYGISLTLLFSLNIMEFGL